MKKQISGRKTLSRIIKGRSSSMANHDSYHFFLTSKPRSSLYHGARVNTSILQNQLSWAWLRSQLCKQGKERTGDRKTNRNEVHFHRMCLLQEIGQQIQLHKLNVMFYTDRPRLLTTFLQNSLQPLIQRTTIPPTLLYRCLYSDVEPFHR